MNNYLTKENIIIIIPGGSGFLGQHIIKELNQRVDGVREIRVLDIVPFEKKLGGKKKLKLNYLIIIQIKKEC